MLLDRVNLVGSSIAFFLSAFEDFCCVIRIRLQANEPECLFRLGDSRHHLRHKFIDFRFTFLEFVMHESRNGCQKSITLPQRGVVDQPGNTAIHRLEDAGSRVISIAKITVKEILKQST